MQLVYEYYGRDVAESRRTLAALVRDGFAEGDLVVEPVLGEVRAVIRKGLSGPIQFMRSVHTGTSFRRCWHHIRARRAAVHLLYFIVDGEMQVTLSTGTYTVRPGCWSLIHADQPFYARTLVGERGKFECALAVVPEHLTRSHLPWADNLTTPFEIGAGKGDVVAGLLNLLCFEGRHMGGQTAKLLSEAFLHALSDGVDDRVTNRTPPVNLIARRFDDIQACIHKYLTCEDLTATRLAAHCGISSRYLFHVLKAHDTSFSDLLWRQRLLKAREWLVCDSFRQLSIEKVARMSGFKSAAHFSRMFKSAYDVSPREYRALHGDQAITT